MDKRNGNSHISSGLERASKVAANIKTSELSKVANNFSINFHEILGLLALPLALVGIGIVESRKLALHATALVSTKNIFKWKDSPEARKEVQNEVKRLMEEMETTSPFIEDAQKQLEALQKMDAVKSSTGFLLRAAISSSWTAFECLAKDLWVVALNSRPIDLAHRTFGSVASDEPHDGLSGKSISVGLLARHGFDLRCSLGSLLAAKFDFTGVRGIKDAYFAAFGKSARLESILSNAELEKLEAIRHLIVHRAGIIDEEFKRRVQMDVVEGEMLVLDDESVHALTDTPLHVGCDLLEFVDERLAGNSAV
jgi:hypothetical protein